LRHALGLTNYYETLHNSFFYGLEQIPLVARLNLKKKNKDHPNV
jgi:hypothetical protein